MSQRRRRAFSPPSTCAPMRLPDTSRADPPKRAALTLLVARAQAGDRQALDRLLRDHQAPLYRHVRAIARDGDHAFDALQNSLLLIARRLAGLRDPRWFKAWAYRIATREAVRLTKRERRIRQIAEEAALAEPPYAP